MTSAQNTLQWPLLKFQLHDGSPISHFQQDSLGIAVGLGTGTVSYKSACLKGSGVDFKSLTYTLSSLQEHIFGSYFVNYSAFVFIAGRQVFISFI